jgi:methylmalonyl-CoA mutase
MTRAIEAGIPKQRIEEAAARRQAAIDSGKEQIVGINLYRLDKEAKMDILEVNNASVREQQVARIKAIRESRNSDKVTACLAALKAGAESNENLLALAVEAARERATLGEISDALEAVFGRFQARSQLITGVYSQSYADTDATTVNDVRAQTDAFAQEQGRRPRILVAKMGQDGHDRGAKVIATAFADLGFDVDVGPLFQTPAETARQAADNDVHVIGMSSLAGGHKTLLPELVKSLAAVGRPDILVVCGGVIPAQDYDTLYSQGASAIFGPGTRIPVAASALVTKIKEHFADAL